MGKEEFYVIKARLLAEQALAWGDSTEWSDLDFEKLGERIFDKTGSLLSITTLKRLWGRVKYDSSPNAATLNVLARFIGFADWRGFKQHIDAERPVIAPVKTSTQKKKSYFPVVLAAAITAVILGVIIAWSFKPKPVKAINLSVPVKFSSRKVTEGLPNSVVFNYDVSALGVDSVTLQQSWDTRRNERLSANLKEHTSIYYYPGYFGAKLLVNGHTIKESPVFIKTNGWMGIIEKDPAPTYLSNADIHLPGGMGISAKTLAAKAGTTVFNNFEISFNNVREFKGLNGGDFILTTTLQNTSTAQESSCRKVRVCILGKSNAIIIPLADKGCISDLYMYTSSEWVNGKNKDLSAFGCDFSKPQQFACSVKDMKLTVNLNGKPIFTAPITQTIGDIIGLSISFEGAGEIKDVKLENSKGVLLDDKF
ncbi:hypothetical protein FFF34_016200 [Inquilinus sp. KBS0705]|nr:hypothetical protein FFF34_016200 [Inquilinus sp. KBS0705]